MKIIKQLTNYLIKKYENEKRKEIDIFYLTQLKEYQEVFSKKMAREILWEMVFSYDIKPPINLKQRYTIYNRMNSDADIHTLFKSLYSKNYQAYFNAKDQREQDILKGRMLQLQDMINCMEIASDRLDNWDKYERINEKKITLKKDINEQILNNN